MDNNLSINAVRGDLPEDASAHEIGTELYLRHRQHLTRLRESRRSTGLDTPGLSFLDVPIPESQRLNDSPLAGSQHPAYTPPSGRQSTSVPGSASQASATGSGGGGGFATNRAEVGIDRDAPPDVQFDQIIEAQRFNRISRAQAEAEWRRVQRLEERLEREEERERRAEVRRQIDNLGIGGQDEIGNELVGPLDAAELRRLNREFPDLPIDELQQLLRAEMGENVHPGMDALPSLDTTRGASAMEEPRQTALRASRKCGKREDDLSTPPDEAPGRVRKSSGSWATNIPATDGVNDYMINPTTNTNWNAKEVVSGQVWRSSSVTGPYTHPAFPGVSRFLGSTFNE